MPFANAAERTWVAVLTGGAAGKEPDKEFDLETQLRIKRAQEIQVDLDHKAALLAQARDVVEKGKAAMQKAFAFEIEVSGKKLPLLGPNGDATKGFDTAETSKVTTAPTWEELKPAQEAMEILVGQKDFLVKQKTNRSVVAGKTIKTETVPLFTTDEVMRELYTPLVRELIIPDTVIEDKYSQTQQMIDGSNDAYLKELESYSEPDGTVEALGKAKEVFDLASKIASTATQGIDIAKTVIDLATKIVDAGLDASSAMIGKADPTAAVPKFAKNVADIVGSILAAATGNAELGKSVTGLAGIAIDSTTSLAMLTKQPEPDFSGFLTSVAAAIEGALSQSVAGEKDEKTKMIVEAVGKGISAAAENVVNAKKKALIEDIKKGNWGAVTATIGGALISLGGTASDITGEAQSVGEETDQQKEIAERGERIKSLLETANLTGEAADKVRENLQKKREELEKTAAEWLKADKDPGPKTPSPADQKKIGEKLDKEMAEQSRLLDQLKGSDKEPDLKSIATLIDQMKRDQAIMAAVSAAGSGGLAVVQTFVAGFPGGALASFLVNVASAVQRAIHLRKWMEANNDADSAVSPYKTAIENFVKNQAEQFSQKTIQAALNVLQVGASVAGMAVPFASVVASGVGLAASLQELTYKYFKERALKSAWKITREALDNPDNRKLALIARRMNPTLAKYTIAYGAVVEKDVVAITAVNRCGLTREVLAEKSANVGAVKTYLETLYPDDGKVLAEYDSGDWRKKLPPPALDVLNWSLAFSTAQKNGGPDGDNPRAVVGQLKMIVQLEATLKGKPTEKDYEAIATALNAVIIAITGLKPSDAKVREFFSNYVDLARSRLAEVDEARTLLFDLAETT